MCMYSMDCLWIHEGIVHFLGLILEHDLISIPGSKLSSDGNASGKFVGGKKNEVPQIAAHL